MLREKAYQEKHDKNLAAQVEDILDVLDNRIDANEVTVEQAALVLCGVIHDFEQMEWASL
jgi:hypothetical protein